MAYGGKEDKGAGGVWTKVLHDKPENLSSIPGLHKVGGKNWLL